MTADPQTETSSRLRADDAKLERLECRLDLIYKWGYEQTRKDLRDLYRKAKRSQWDSDAQLPWTTDVDVEKPSLPEPLHPLWGSDVYVHLDARQRVALERELTSWRLSQFLHGEQGALMAATQLVQTVPDADSTLYAASQVFDEARHVETYDRYLTEKVGFSYPVSPYLKKLLDLILTDSRWDMKLLGMQIMVEGLALAALGGIREYTLEPLLREVTQYVMLDEARHVAYGVLSLREYYAGMNAADVREREDFVYESAILMRERFLFQQVWEKVGLPADRCAEITLGNTFQRIFRQRLFSRIVPAVKSIGLLSDRQRARFEALGVLQFEDAAEPVPAPAGDARS